MNKELADYLNKYIEHEINCGGYEYEPCKNMDFTEWIFQGLEAYQSISNISDEDC
jgi:hypothetical protein